MNIDRQSAVGGAPAPHAAPDLAAQARFWDEWNRKTRTELPLWAQLTQRFVIDRLRRLPLSHPAILEVGCGTGWLSSALSNFGPTTGTDLAAGVIQEAQARYPHIRFIAGDVQTVDLPEHAFDVVVSVGVLPHVADQAAFIARCAAWLKPDRYFLLISQNRYVLERSDVLPSGDSLRHWLYKREYAELLAPYFHVLEYTTLIPPFGHGGVLRVVNSEKLNRVAGAVFGREHVEDWKLKAGLGRDCVFLTQLKHAA